MTAGFERVRAFSGQTGKEIDPSTGAQPDPRIYFLCRHR